jgi:hypothetical protein
VVVFLRQSTQVQYEPMFPCLLGFLAAGSW